MAYITKKYPIMNSSSGTEFLADVDTRLWNIATDLDAVGWEVEYRYPMALYECTEANIPSFDGSNPDRYTVFKPAWSSYAGPFLMVVDSVPPAYSPPPGYVIFITTGTTLGSVILNAVIAAIQFMESDIINLGSDPGSSFPADRNKLLMYSGPSWIDNGKAKLEGNPELFFTVNGILQGLRVSTNPNSRASLGGYVCRCATNGEDEDQENNYTSVFFYRAVSGGSLNPHPIAIVAARDIGEQPVLGTLAGGESFRPADMTGSTLVQLTQASFRLCCGPNHLAIAQNSDGVTGHLEIAALDLPIITAGILDATVGIIGVGNTESKFRNGPHGSSGTGMILWRNGEYANVEGSGVGTLRLMSLYPGGSSVNVAPWENGNGQITEPWAGFNLDLTLPASVMGKFPGALIIGKSYPADDMEAFEFDNVLWVVFGQSVGYTSNGNQGTICFRSDDGWIQVVDPEEEE